MGEASRRRQQIIAGERCIYCDNQATTVEHMPPRLLFRNRDRPSGMEFGACKACNNETGAADLVAGFIALMANNMDLFDWRFEAARALKGRLRQKAPGVVEEIFSSTTLPQLLEHQGAFRTAIGIELQGSKTKAYLSVFAAKFGMALFRECVGVPLPMDGGVESRVSMNAAYTQHLYESSSFMLPAGGTLRQGKKSAGDQIHWSFNTDKRTIVAALVTIHGLSILIFATSDPRTYGFPTDDMNAAYTHPGQLSRLMALAR